ncbi:NAD(P)-binding protein [Hypoxylon rubiginosum]|uniref:NAD(P)-binding protein n=1 Tax=Hypoxylon rubiginosum TaxID=110542 RepID=A0ACB9Z5C5_9PEZI|nr:NAD(P)-binding protein [Hypoxylon rubiginosum]
MAAALRYIGAASLTYAAFKLFEYASFYLLPPASLARYHSKRRGDDAAAWALITGASAGIGFGTAQELAARGFNVVLLGHLPAELDAAAAIIKAESRGVQVRIVVLDAITAAPCEIEAALLEPSLGSLPITVLVNNVGGVPIPQLTIRNLSEYTAEDLDRTLNLNARFMAHVSRILLPQLAANGPALVLNISSAARIGIPGVALYSACKGFIMSLTAAMAREVAAAGKQVDCLAIIPGDVRTQSNTVGLTPGSPDARQFGKEMLDRAPWAVQRGWLACVPWWSHAVAIGALGMLPRSVVLRLLLTEFDKKKAAVAKLLKQS